MVGFPMPGFLTRIGMGARVFDHAARRRKKRAFRSVVVRAGATSGCSDALPVHGFLQLRRGEPKRRKIDNILSYGL